MRHRLPPARRLPTLVLAATAVAAMAAAPSAGAAKKNQKAAKLDITQTVNAAIPDKGPLVTDPAGRLVATIKVGKQFNGLAVRDVNLTLQTTGSAANAAMGLAASLSAPNKGTSMLFFSLGGQSVGPLTLDDESPAPCPVPEGLCIPYAGRARPGSLSAPGALWPLDGGPVRGEWKLRVYDVSTGDTNVLNSWRLQVATRRQFVAK
jgi:hypothetical protein